MKTVPLPGLSRREALKSLAFTLAASGSTGMLSARKPIPDPAWTSLDLTANRYLTLPVTVNGRSLQGIVDSGTTQSIIRQDIALDLGLPYLGTAWAETFTRQLSGSLYRVDRFELSGIEIRNLAIGTFDTSAVSEGLHQQLPIILGQDILRTIDIEADFVGGRIRGLPLGASPAWPEHKLLPLYGTDKSFPSVRLLLEGQHHDDAIADFGNDVPMLMSGEFARDTGLLKGRPTSTAMTVGIDGPALTRIFCLYNVQFGPFAVHGLPVQIIDDWRMALPVYVGWPFFRAFDTVLSLGHQTLRLRADPAILNSEFPKDRSGLGARREVDRLILVHVARNSPAWTAGLRDDDVITSIDGMPVSASHPAPGKRLGIQPAGTPMNVGLADGRQIAFTLADYF